VRHQGSIAHPQTMATRRLVHPASLCSGPSRSQAAVHGLGEAGARSGMGPFAMLELQARRPASAALHYGPSATRIARSNLTGTSSTSAQTLHLRGLFVAPHKAWRAFFSFFCFYLCFSFSAQSTEAERAGQCSKSEPSRGIRHGHTLCGYPPPPPYPYAMPCVSV